MVTEEQKRKMLQLYAFGDTYAGIAGQFGISRQRVQQIVRPPKPIYDALKEKAKGECMDCGIAVQSGHVHHELTKGSAAETINQIRSLLYLCPSCHRLRHVHGARKIKGKMERPAAISVAELGREIKSEAYECLRCGAIFVPRKKPTDTIRGRCAKCKSPCWNVPIPKDGPILGRPRKNTQHAPEDARQ